MTNINTIYMPVCKCWTRSFKHLFKYHNNILIAHHNMVDYPNYSNSYLLYNNTLWKNSFKFAFVRNPIDRFISAINYFSTKNITNDIDYVLNIMDNDSQNFFDLNDKNSFIKRHILPISHPHYHIVENNNIVINQFFQLENIHNEWESICNLLHIPKSSKIQHINKSNKIFNRDNISKKHMKKIQSFYETDTILFKYI